MPARLQQSLHARSSLFVPGGRDLGRLRSLDGVYLDLVIQFQASAICFSSAERDGRQPSTCAARSDAPTRIGGSPTRRGRTCVRIARRETRSAAATTSFTE